MIITFKWCLQYNRGQWNKCFELKPPRLFLSWSQTNEHFISTICVSYNVLPIVYGKISVAPHHFDASNTFNDDDDHHQHLWLSKSINIVFSIHLGVIVRCRRWTDGYVILASSSQTINTYKRKKNDLSDYRENKIKILLIFC